MNGPSNDNIRRLRRKSVVGQLVLLLLGVELMFFASFTSLVLPTPTQRNIERVINSAAQQAIVYLKPQWQERVLDQFPVLRRSVPPIRTSTYVPLVPVALFIGYVLGVPLGCLSALSYVVLGLVGPIIGVLPFAGGGGLDYCKQPSFGYLLGLVVGSWFTGRITAAANTSVRQILAIVGGLSAVHVCGLLYLVGGCLGLLVFVGEAAYLRWQPWLFESIRNLSWYQLPYDALLTLALVGVGSPFRWLNTTLTAPDIAMKPKARFDQAQLERVS